MAARILVAGVGNVFLGDDGFGVQVVERLQGDPWPAEVRVADFGIRGFDLALALLAGYEVAVLIDATGRGGTPGTLYVMQLDGQEPVGERKTDPHAMRLEEVFRLVREWGGELPQLLLVGCEPGSLVPEVDSWPELGLSTAVEQAVKEAVPLVHSLVARLLGADLKVVG